jgi:hypothetical protein
MVAKMESGGGVSFVYDLTLDDDEGIQMTNDVLTSVPVADDDDNDHDDDNEKKRKDDNGYQADEGVGDDELAR